ncbi:MAG TPA: shikimate kinase [Flavobacteriaceae bacterium]|nr:shikimate kinase [Flavobacteriaceae bacterium]
MKLVLCGYMGSGKSEVGKLVAKHLEIGFCDLDAYISEKEGEKISDIFKNKGEIYFRKMENMALKECLSFTNCQIIALGGGTPCYGNNLELLKQNKVKMVYLKTSLEILTQRLFEQKESRPMISHYHDKGELEDFIRKHLFERSFYYLQSDVILSADGKTIHEIAHEIEKMEGR